MEQVNKTVQKLRFKQEDGSDYPVWEEKKLGEITEIKTGDTFSKTNLSLVLNDKTPVPLYNGGIKPTGYIDLANENFPSVIIARVGTVGSVLYEDQSFFFGDSSFVINDVNKNKYLFYSLSNNNDKIIKASTKSVVTSISKTSLQSIKIPLPSLPEQEKIGEFFSKLDERIEAQTKLVELLKQQKKGYSQQIFNGSLRFKQDDGSNYPDWEEKKLGDLVSDGTVKLGRGRVISKKDMIKSPGSNPVYSSSAQNNGLFGNLDSYDFHEEMISWSVDGGGKLFYREKHKFSLTNVAGWIRNLNSEKINMKFLFNALVDAWSKEKFDYLNKAHPSVIEKLYSINLPSLAEQEKIGSFLSALDNEIEQEENKLQAYKQEKQAYSQRMLG